MGLNGGPDIFARYSLTQEAYTINFSAQLFLVSEKSPGIFLSMQLFPPTYVLQLFGAFDADWQGEIDKKKLK